MKKKTLGRNLVSRFTALLMAVIMVVGVVYVPALTAEAAPSDDLTRSADASTVDSWKNYFTTEKTEYAGGVWTDKSVYTGDTSPTIDGKTINMTDTGDNFLVALSALASNKEIKGYSTIPTDTVLILDLSSSMRSKDSRNQSAVDELVEATNDTIEQLLKLNKNNRVAVVSYAGNTNKTFSNAQGATTIILPMDSYTTTKDGVYLEAIDVIENPGSWNQTVRENWALKVASGVKNSSGSTVSASMETARGTFMQDGIYEAMKILLNTEDTTVADGVQAGTTRIPIMVLMTDGEPTLAHHDYNGNDARTDLGTSTMYSYDYRNRSNQEIHRQTIAFLSMLTAAYAKREVEQHYGTSGLFYTLAFGDVVNNRSEALSVLNPSRTNSTINGYWNSFLAGNSVDVYWNNNHSRQYSVSNDKAEPLTAADKLYVDEYFHAETDSDLLSVFRAIVAEIKIQSAYYPTFVNTKDEDHDGYVTFTDKIGEYMQVTDVKGILLDKTFYSGEAMADAIAGNTIFGTVTNPNAAGDQLVWSVQERLHIDSVEEARSLIEKAYNAGQLGIKNGVKSNYIGWFSNSQGEYLGWWDGNLAIDTAGVPADATHVVKSYGYLGAAGDTDMMYISVRLTHNIATGEEMMVWQIPASLVPTVTYEVEVKEDYAASEMVALNVTTEYPIRLLYEVALESHITPETADSMVAEGYAYKNADGTYTFYTNQWTADYEDTKKNTYSHFEPSVSNEWFYYVADTPVYEIIDPSNTDSMDEDNYRLATQIEPGKTYYHRWVGYSKTLGTHWHFEEITELSLQLAEKDSDGYHIPKGTVMRYMEKANVNKSSNVTGTSPKINHTWISDPVGTYGYYGMTTLGNNGKLVLDPVLPKTVSIDPVNGGAVIEDGDGKTVAIGDVLTYKVKVVNTEAVTADVTVTDQVPAGTTLVAGSITEGGTVNNSGLITWTFDDMASGAEKEVSFQVTVNEDILAAGFTTVNNTAYVSINNSPAYTTNTTVNPPSGKKVELVDGDTTVVVPDSGIGVGSELVYRVTYSNDETEAAKVTITDVIPEGTRYIDGTASHNGTYNASTNTLTWTIDHVQPGATGTVSFRVIVVASAKEEIENEAVIKIGENGPEVKTNIVTTKVDKADLSITKNVVFADPNYPAADAAERYKTVFTLKLAEAGGELAGEYELLRDGAAEKITFNKGEATVTIKHGQVLQIKDLPANVDISVVETAVPGYTPSYSGLAKDGYITLKAGQMNQVAVTNTYAVTPAVFQLEGTKTLTGDTLVPDLTFTFTSQECTATATGTNTITGVTVDPTAAPIVATATVTNNGKSVDFSFSPRSFSKAGTYYYLIKEQNAGQTGVTYDETQYLLKIVVSDDGKGALSTDMTLYSRENENSSFTLYNEAENAKVTFTNSYAPKETQLVLEATKKLDNLALQAGMFSFEVRDKNDPNGEPITTGQNNADGTITFRPITYKASDLPAGTHTKTFIYVVSEVNNQLTGITYDTDTFEVTVTLTDTSGQLVATASYPSGGVVFENTYAPGGASVTLEADKVLSGEARVLKVGEFSFVVEDASGKAIASGTNEADGDVFFAAIGYDLEDLADGTTVGTVTSKTFTYKIREIKPDLSYDPFVEYDTTEYTVEVTVSYDSSNGELSVSAPVYKKNGNAVTGAVFTNIVNKNYVEITPNTLTKSTTGNNIPTDAAFSFSVLDMSGAEVGTGIGAANGEIKFSALSFDRVGEYDFWIQETNAGAHVVNGITYDSTRYLLKITVTYDEANSELKASQQYYALKAGGDKNDAADYTEALKAPHFTNKYEAKGSATVSAKKVLSGRELNAGEFSFHLTRLDNGKVTNGYMKEDGSVEFASMYYTNNDIPQGATSAEIKYKMTEIVPADANKLPGVTYDSGVYYVVVTLTTDGTDKIATSVKYYTDEACETEYKANAVPVFTNTYAPKENTSTKIEVSKELTGRDLKAGEFSFDLYHVKEDGTEAKVESAINDADGKIEFIRTYYAANWPVGQTSLDVKYLIRETPGSLGGVTYSTQVFGVTLTIVNNTQTGKLEVDADSIKYYEGNDFTKEIEKAKVVFTNSYEAQGTTYTPVAEKSLTGRAMADNEFAFEVRTFDPETGVTGDPVSTGLSKKDGSVVFTPIGYSNEPGTSTKTLYYVMHEIAGNMGGVTYDDAKYYLAVTITDKGLGAVEVADVVYYSGYDTANKTFTGTVEKAVFENTYTTTDASVQLEATKVLTGRDLVEGEFDFVVKEGNDIVTYGTNAADGKIIFGTIGYQAVGTHTYTVSELEPSDAIEAGITVDTKTFTVTVTVTDDNKGNLVPEVTYPQGGIVFENSYSADPVSIDLHAMKYLVNKVLEKDEFTFEVKDKDGNVISTAKNAADGLIDFDFASGSEEKLEFTAPGEYTYTITERKDLTKAEDTTNPDGSINKAGTYTYDEAVYSVKVKVSDNYTGKLVADVTYYKNGTGENDIVNAIEFINSYVPGTITGTDLSLTIGAKKTVTSPDGIKYELKGNDFSFTIYDVANNVITTGTNDKDGNIINFAPFVFETAGIYHYWIAEDATDKTGITIDSNAWELIIQVSYDAETGKLYIDEKDVITYPYTRATDEEKAPVFENIYNPAPAELTITANKTLTGRPLKANEFVFVVTEDVNGESVIRGGARNDADGNISITFEVDTIGEKTYQIKEVLPSQTEVGVTYSETIGTVKVTVTDDNSGQLKIESQSAATVGSGITFVNVYTPANVTAVIEAKKVVAVAEGSESAYELKGGEFSFELLDAEGNRVGEPQTNDADGNVVFGVKIDDAQMVDADGKSVDEKKFTYTIREIEPAAEADKVVGITYDKTEHSVVVTVVDDHAGKLVASVAYTEGKVPVITNSYKGGAAKVVVEATKTLTGKALLEGAYIFELVDVDGKVAAEAKNDAEGKIKFIFGLDEVGEYTYTMREKVGTDANTTYDEKTYEVKVKVTDNMAGQMVAEVTYQDGVAPTFNNTYTPNGIGVTLTGTKTLTGRKMVDGEFKFLVTDSIGALVATGINAADGTITFTEIMMPAVGQYTLTVAEVKDNIAGITYDESTYQVTVDVTNEDGVLKAAVTYPEGGLKFNNKFVDLDLKDTGDNTSLTLWTIMLIASVAAAGAVMVTRRRRRA